jgi:hypothetical protein
MQPNNAATDQDTVASTKVQPHAHSQGPVTHEARRTDAQHFWHVYTYLSVIGCYQQLHLPLPLQQLQLQQPPLLLQVLHQHPNLCAPSPGALQVRQDPSHLAAQLARQQMQQALLTSPTVLP